MGHEDDRPPQGPPAEPGLPGRGGRRVSSGENVGGPIGNSLAVGAIKLFVVFLILLAIAAGLHSWSHGLLL